MRTCAWCEWPIDRPGSAHPIMYARLPGVGQNWQCADRAACEARMAELERRAGMVPVTSSFRLALTAGKEVA